MKKQQNVVVFKLLVLVFMTAFIVGSFANMLCIPRYVPDNATAHISSRRTYRSSCRGTSFIQLFDRSTVDDIGIAKSVFTPKALDLIPESTYLQVAETAQPSPQIQTPYSHKYVYLSYCSFRI